MQKIFSTRQESVNLMSEVPYILSAFNKNNLYALRKKFEPICIPITYNNEQLTLVIECDAKNNGVINQCKVFAGEHLSYHTIEAQKLQSNKSYTIDNGSSAEIPKMVEAIRNQQQRQQLKNEEIAIVTGYQGSTI